MAPWLFALHTLKSYSANDRSLVFWSRSRFVLRWAVNYDSFKWAAMLSEDARLHQSSAKIVNAKKILEGMWVAILPALLQHTMLHRTFELSPSGPLGTTCSWRSLVHVQFIYGPIIWHRMFTNYSMYQILQYSLALCGLIHISPLKRTQANCWSSQHLLIVWPCKLPLAFFFRTICLLWKQWSVRKSCSFA